MRADNKINVLVVDDSGVARMLLTRLLESDPQIRVMDALDNGQAAVDFINRTKPDVVLMDIQMPLLDGFEATRRIMETQPVPIIICTATTNPKEVATTFRSLEAGAVACLEKPVAQNHPEYEVLARSLLETIKLMSEVKVVRRWPRSHLSPQTSSRDELQSEVNAIRLVGIGASTGGPTVLQTILGSLPKDFSVPILIVQHIAPGFLSGLVEWLNQTTGLHIHVAAHNASPLPGHAYLAPDDLHMGIGRGGRISLTREKPENNLRPAVSYLFRSLAEIYGRQAIGILLSGMGKDGAAELKLMKDNGATTIAQDRESSVVHGMPGEAIELGAASRVLAADKIAHAVIELTSQRRAGGTRL